MDKTILNRIKVDSPRHESRKQYFPQENKKITDWFDDQFAEIQ